MSAVELAANPASPARSRRWWCALAAIGTAAFSTAPSRADVPMQSAMRLLRSRDVTTSLADDRGKLPLLVPLPAGVAASDRGLLPVAPGFGAIHLDVGQWDRFMAANPDLSPRWAPPRRPLLDRAHNWTRGPVFRDHTGLDGSGVVVGIIDTGIDVSHPDFRRADGSTRIEWLLLSSAPRGLHPQLEQRYGCTDPAQRPCAILSAADIDELLDNAAAGDEPSDSSGHGTHVASVAAGNGGVMLDGELRYVGMAPGASLVIAAPSVSGEFSDPAILNAARFVFEQAESMGMPAVVNVSLGSDFGPHDGSSSLEQGLAAMVGKAKPGRAMVVAAGNSGDLYEIEGRGPFGVHTEVHVSSHAVTRVPMTVPGYEGTVSGAGYVWLTFRPGDEVNVGLEGPDGDEWVSLVEPGEEAGYESDDGDISAGVVNNRSGGGAEMPANTNGAVVVFTGSWRAEEQIAVLLQGRGHAQLWVTGTGELATGLLGVGLSFERALRAGTIGVPASHPDIIAVGCTLNRTGWKALGVPGMLEIASFGGVEDPELESLCYFSGAGPTATGLMKPDVVAPGAYVAGAMSRDADPRQVAGGVFDSPGCPANAPACHVVDPGHALTTGTSMASPQVAGALALLLERDPSLTQAELLDLIQAGAHFPSGRVPFDYQLGPGALDMGGTLQVLERQQAGQAEPDPWQSFYVLSAPYARPDPSSAVEGVVQVRASDGSVAVGAGGGGLTLHVTGGLVVQQPTRVQAGTWRFALAAPRGSGGTVMEVDVRYQNVSLGRRLLPIGSDPWAATAGVAARGSGCTVGPARSARPTAVGLLGLALGLRATRRRRIRAATSGRAGGSTGACAHHRGDPDHR